MSKPINLKTMFTCLASTVLAAGVTVNTVAGPLETSIAIEQEMNKASQATQKTVDGLADQTLDMAQTYQLTLQSIDSIKRYNRSIEGYITRQQAEMDSIQVQMDGIDRYVASRFGGGIEGWFDAMEAAKPDLLIIKTWRLKRYSSENEKAVLRWLRTSFKPGLVDRGISTWLPIS